MKDVLIFVSGLTPQVVTETLYYLTQSCDPSRHVAEIYLLTTSLGKERAEGNMLSLCEVTETLKLNAVREAAGTRRNKPLSMEVSR